MPNSYVPVSPEEHRSMRWQRFTNFAFARDNQVVDIAMSETPKLCMANPILFRMAGEKPVPCALLGLEPGQNAYLSADFRWLASYTPALLRASLFCSRSGATVSTGCWSTRATSLPIQVNRSSPKTIRQRPR